jgi:hypothetical protein
MGLSEYASQTVKLKLLNISEYVGLVSNTRRMVNNCIHSNL